MYSLAKASGRCGFSALIVESRILPRPLSVLVLSKSLHSQQNNVFRKHSTLTNSNKMVVDNDKKPIFDVPSNVPRNNNVPTHTSFPKSLPQYLEQMDPPAAPVATVDWRVFAAGVCLLFSVVSAFWAWIHFHFVGNWPIADKWKVICMSTIFVCGLGMFFI
eukprot:GHVL01033071.1.p1 GENE.GHVL01033071.1~~GHVL01033071.1.p1  ORF type:complete len:161 (+),score=13.66 GHVL01033071.1:24-506(+)